MSIERLTQSKRRRRLSNTYPDVTIEECWLQSHEENSPWFQTIVFEGPREAIEKLAPQGRIRNLGFHRRPPRAVSLGAGSPFDRHHYCADEPLMGAVPVRVRLYS
jgi:hypothetical protein